MNTQVFPFEELPLVIEKGFEAGLVDGEALISYHADGEWSIDAISLDGHKWNGAGSKIDRSSVELDIGTPLYLAIYHRLEHEWRDQVQDVVNQAINGDRACQADNRADYRRDERKHMGAM